MFELADLSPGPRRHRLLQRSTNSKYMHVTTTKNRRSLWGKCNGGYVTGVIRQIGIGSLPYIHDSMCRVVDVTLALITTQVSCSFS